MEVAGDITLDYLKTRKQLRRASAKFQGACSTRMVDMRTELDAGHAMAILAAAWLDEADNAERTRTLTAASS